MTLPIEITKQYGFMDGARMRKYLRRILKKVSGIGQRLERLLVNRTDLARQNRDAAAKPEDADNDWWAIK